MCSLRHLPDSDDPDVRDYLFIDDARVALLLAQFGEGTPMTRSEIAGRTKQLKLGWDRIFSIGKENQYAETAEISLSAMHVTMLEEDATAFGMHADLSAAAKRKDWLRGKVRQRLAPGSLIRVTAPTRVTDPRNMIDHFFTLAEAFEDDDGLQQMRASIHALYGQALGFSCYPCDEDQEAAFEGFIETQRQGVWFDRETLTSRLGTEPQEMTCLMQVSRVPTERDSYDWQRSFRSIAAQLQHMDPDRLNRSLLNRFLEGIVEALESTGLRAAPRWPAIAATPLALYRQVPLALAEEDLGDFQSD